MARPLAAARPGAAQRVAHARTPRGRRAARGAGVSARVLVAAVISAIAIFPLAYMLSLSFQPVGDILTVPPVLIPPHPTFVNYVQAWAENDFSGYFVNSLLISLGTVAGVLFLSALTAFAFARYRFWGKETIFYFMLATLAVPGILLILPQYLLMSRFDLLDSRFGLVLLYVASNIPFTTFLLRGFFEQVAPELEEAMRLDGVTELGLLVRLILPLSVPAFITAAIFTFNAAWDEFILASTLINTASHRTLPIALALFINAHTTAWGPMFAASMIATVPSVIVFALAQRWFQQGVSVSALH